MKSKSEPISLRCKEKLNIFGSASLREIILFFSPGETYYTRLIQPLHSWQDCAAGRRRSYEGRQNNKQEVVMGLPIILATGI